jgi:cation transport ATPase
LRLSTIRLCCSGEPFPVAKPVGGQVFGATVNQLVVLVVRVTASGSTTVRAKIVHLMKTIHSTTISSAVFTLHHKSEWEQRLCCMLYLFATVLLTAAINEVMNGKLETPDHCPAR